MIKVHHLENSRSQRIVWLLEELGVPYEIERHARDPETMLAPAALAAVHPLGKAPIVEADGAVLIESGAIIEHLIARHGPHLAPAAGTPDHLRYLTFLHFAEGSLMPPLLMRLIFATMAQKAPALARPLVRLVTTPVATRYVTPTLTRILDFLESELATRPFFAGATFSGADIQMSFPLEKAAERGGLDGSRPQLMGFLARMRGREGYRRAKVAMGA